MFPNTYIHKFSEFGESLAQNVHAFNEETVMSTPVVHALEHGVQRGSGYGSSVPTRLTDHSYTRREIQKDRSAGSGQQNQKKRTRKNAPNLVRGIQQAGERELVARALACPYYKRDKAYYHECGDKHFTRFPDLRQHIDRVHVFKFYCTICHQGFSKDADRDGHIRQQSCYLIQQWIGPGGSFPGPSRHQFQEISSNSMPRLTTEEKWTVFFRGLFPGYPVPNDPYADQPWLPNWTRDMKSDFIRVHQNTDWEATLATRQVSTEAMAYVNNIGPYAGHWPTPDHVLAFFEFQYSEYLESRMTTAPQWLLWTNEPYAAVANSS